MSKCKFWPLDFDLEGEIYENPAWDLPGFRRTHGPRSVHRPKPRTKAATRTSKSAPPGWRDSRRRDSTREGSMAFTSRYPVEIFQ